MANLMKSNNLNNTRKFKILAHSIRKWLDAFRKNETLALFRSTSRPVAIGKLFHPLSLRVIYPNLDIALITHCLYQCIGQLVNKHALHSNLPWFDPERTVDSAYRVLTAKSALVNTKADLALHF